MLSKLRSRSKTTRSKGKTAREVEYHSRVASLGCILAILKIPHQCKGRTTVHHCGTAMGCKKNHMKVIPLCWNMHLGSDGIDGKHMSKRQWESKYGTEEELLDRVRKLLG